MSVCSITLDPYGMKVLMPDTEWVAPPPTLMHFSPGHAAQIQMTPGDANVTDQPVYTYHEFGKLYKGVHQPWQLHYHLLMVMIYHTDKVCQMEFWRLL